MYRICPLKYSHCKDDWNGFGAQRVYDLVIAIAEQFVMIIPFGRKYPDQVSPDGEGGLILKWSLDKNNLDKRLILTFEAGLIHVAYKPVQGEAIYKDDIMYLGDGSIPQEILTCIPLIKQY